MAGMPAMAAIIRQWRLL